MVKNLLAYSFVLLLLLNASHLATAQSFNLNQSFNTTTSIAPTSILEGDVSVLYQDDKQITYFIIINKTSELNIGIFHFTISGINARGYPEYINNAHNNCIILSQIQCTTTFLLQEGNFTTLNVFSNSKSVGSLSLNDNVYVPYVLPIQTIYVANDTQVLEIAGGILIILVIGNIIFLIKERKNLYTPTGLRFKK